jgi:hypothetical protein
VKVKAPKPVKVKTPKPEKVKSSKPRRPGRIAIIAIAAAVVAGATGFVLDRWVDYVTDTDVPATVVTTDGE